MQPGILVPLDGSQQAESALPIAMMLAGRMRATLHLVHVHVPFMPLDTIRSSEPPTISIADLEMERRGMEQAYLARIQEPLQVAVAAPVARALCEGPVPDALLAYARARSIGLIVMTTHGQGPLVRVWLGSITELLVRQTEVPVLLVRPRPDGELTPPPIGFRRVFVPLDGSEFAEDVLAATLALMDDTASLTLIRVAMLPRLVGTVMRRDAPALEQLEVQRRRTVARDELAATAARIYPPGKHIEARVLTAQQPAVALLEEARTSGCDLIALSPQGRSGRSRTLVGSIADKLLRISECPVLVVPRRQDVEIPNQRARDELNTCGNAIAAPTRVMRGRLGSEASELAGAVSTASSLEDDHEGAPNDSYT